MATYTAADLANIEQALANGVLIVRYQDRTVTYRSVRELKEIRDDIVRSLAPPRSRQTIVVGKKGF